jgi:hypothetical protein
MREGWSSDDYLILFDKEEIAAATDRYQITQFLPGFEVIGLRGWDDFLVRNSAGQVFCVPTVPLTPKHLERFTPPSRDEVLETDVRFKGRIKWYIHPVVFGGSPQAQENMIWVDHVQHAELVRQWNERYRDLTSMPTRSGE